MPSLRPALSLILLALCTAWADVLPKRIVCYNDVLEPYFMVDGNRFSGINADLMREAARRAGVELEFQHMPWKRLEEEIKKGAASSVECAFAFSRTPAREAYMSFTNVPMQRTEYVLFVRKNMPVAGLDDLAGKVIGVHRGFRLPDQVAAGASAGRFYLEENASDRANFQKLASGRIDAVLINYDVGMYLLGQLGTRDIHALQPPLSYLDTFLVFTKGKPASGLVPLFDIAIASAKQDGSHARIRQRYLGQ